MKETYIFLNREDVERNRAFLKALWESQIPAIYRQFSRSKDIIQITLEEFIASMQEPRSTDTNPTRLVLGQKSTLSKTGRLIRFLTANSCNVDADFCCDCTPQNLRGVEELFLRTYEKDFASYPNRYTEEGQEGERK
ncbi:hypothetical protein FJZ17_02345 [Candidatus Pacearchaeota archaeon]|nr:hypothetical protein [Candidatus Pacearchaeota archaeon]